jgi:predicted alpha/beta hydrolase family esterase
VQRDWDRPERDEWMPALASAVAAAGPRVVFVAHSLACLQVAHWAQRSARPVRGALLVAVPDPASAAFPAEAASFGPVPLAPLPFHSIVVASRDNPYGSLAHAARCARGLGSRLVCIGAAAHIDAASHLGAWPAGFELLRSLVDG